MSLWFKIKSLLLKPDITPEELEFSELDVKMFNIWFKQKKSSDFISRPENFLNPNRLTIRNVNEWIFSFYQVPPEEVHFKKRLSLLIAIKNDWEKKELKN